jgi:hypothetical protein
MSQRSECWPDRTEVRAVPFRLEFRSGFETPRLVLAEWFAIVLVVHRAHNGNEGRDASLFALNNLSLLEDWRQQRLEMRKL